MGAVSKYPQEANQILSELENALPVCPTLGDLEAAVEIGLGLARREQTSKLLSGPDVEEATKLAGGLVNIGKYVESRKQAKKSEESLEVDTAEGYEITGEDSAGGGNSSGDEDEDN